MIIKRVASKNSWNTHKGTNRSYAVTGYEQDYDTMKMEVDQAVQAPNVQAQINEMAKIGTVCKLQWEGKAWHGQGGRVKSAHMMVIVGQVAYAIGCDYESESFDGDGEYTEQEVNHLHDSIRALNAQREAKEAAEKFEAMKASVAADAAERDAKAAEQAQAAQVVQPTNEVVTAAQDALLQAEHAKLEAQQLVYAATSDNVEVAHDATMKAASDYEAAMSQFRAVQSALFKSDSKIKIIKTNAGLTTYEIDLDLFHPFGVPEHYKEGMLRSDQPSKTFHFESYATMIELWESVQFEIELQYINQRCSSIIHNVASEFVDYDACCIVYECIRYIKYDGIDLTKIDLCDLKRMFEKEGVECNRDELWRTFQTVDLD